MRVSSDINFLAAEQRHGINAGGQRRLLIVVEHREFLRGCLRCWLDSCCPDVEARVISDTDASLHDDMLPRAAAVLITAHAPTQLGPWLERQVQRLRSRRAGVPIMILVDGNDLARAEALAAQWGLQSCLSLSSSVHIAAAAVRLVAGDGTGLTPAPGRTEAAERLAPRGRAEREPDRATFTPREREVLELLGRGLPNKIIAYELNMAVGTVKVHVHNIITKFKVRNRTGAAIAARAMQLGREPLGLPVSAAVKPLIEPAARIPAEL